MPEEDAMEAAVTPVLTFLPRMHILALRFKPEQTKGNLRCDSRL
jgi:hypothetical protein